MLVHLDVIKIFEMAVRQQQRLFAEPGCHLACQPVGHHPGVGSGPDRVLENAAKINVATE